MAEAKYQTSRRKLPPPPGLKPPPETPDQRNMVLKVLEKSGAHPATSGKPQDDDVPVSVSDPKNLAPLYLAWNAARDAALHVMQERHRRESHSSSDGSWSSFTVVLLIPEMRPSPRKGDKHQWKTRITRHPLW